MKQYHILHLFSNWKWTGPAEHAVNLAVEQKRLGHKITFVCANPVRGGDTVLERKARERGLTVWSELSLSKHLHPFRGMRTFRVLKKFLRDTRPDFVHTHLPNDHLLGGAACRRELPNVPIVRTSYEGEGMKWSLRNRHLLNRLTDLLMVVSDVGARKVQQAFRFPHSRIKVVQIPVDAKRFDPGQARSSLRPQYGIDPQAAVVGIVARVQKHRRFNVLLEATAAAVKKAPGLRLMIIGRGTHIEQIAKHPVREMGLEETVIFTDYRKEDYVETLSCLDIKVFLVPGSDGSCRAVREAMAMGKPVVAARRGMLPEIVIHEKTGLVIDDTPEKLADAILALVSDPARASRMGKMGRKRALDLFSKKNYVNSVLASYLDIASL